MQSLWRNNHVELWCEDEKVAISGSYNSKRIKYGKYDELSCAKAKVKK